MRSAFHHVSNVAALQYITEMNSNGGFCVRQVTMEAHRVFQVTLDRQQRAERIKSVMAMLKRYDSLFRLPTRIRQATERGDFEQVISDHRKAKALMETLATSSSEVWHNLFLEVAKVAWLPCRICTTFLLYAAFRTAVCEVSDHGLSLSILAQFTNLKSLQALSSLLLATISLIKLSLAP